MARLLIALLLVTLLCASVNAQAIIVEAEDYVASYDAGGTAIYVTACSGASGGYAIEGFDHPGDWIEIVLNIGENESRYDWLRSAGDDGKTSDLRSTIYGAGPAGEDHVSDFSTQGLGIG